MKTRGRERCVVLAISGCSACLSCLLLGWIALAPISAQAQAATLQYNVEYKCGGERVVVGHCRSDSDRPGYPATTPDQDYCQVYYPDRPRRNGFQAMAVELRSDVVKKLQACGVLAASQPKSPQRGVSATPQPSAQPYATVTSAEEARDLWQRIIRETDTFEGEDDFGLFFVKPGHAYIYCRGIITNDGKPYRVEARDGRVVLIIATSAPWSFVLRPDGSLVSLSGHTFQWQGGKQCAVDVLSPKPRTAAKHTASTTSGGAVAQRPSAPAKANAQPSGSAATAPAGGKSQPSASAAAGAEAYLHQALSYVQAKNYPKAIEACKQAINLDPSAADAYNLLGSAYYNQGQYQLAISAYKQSVVLEPDATTFILIGNAHGELKQYEEALKAYRSAIALKPKSETLALAHYWIGRTYYDLKQYQNAVPALRESLRLNPDDDIAAYMLGRIHFAQFHMKDALPWFQQAVRLNPNDVNNQFYLGATLHTLGLIEKDLEPKAAGALKEAIRLQPDYADAHYLLGQTYVEMGKKEEALQIYKKLQALDKDQAQKLYEEINKAPNSQPASKGSSATTAPASATNTNPAPAKTPAQSSTPAAPPSSQPTTALEYLKLGDKLSQQQDYAKEIEAYKAGIALNPDNTNAANASNSMGVAYYRLKQYTDAVAAFQQAIRFKPDYPQALDNLGFNYNILKQYEKAVPAFREALRLKPDYAEASYLLGVAHFNLKQYPEAAAAFRQGINLKPGDVVQYPDAVAAFQETVRLKPGDAEARYHLGYTYFLLNQYESALAPLQESLRLQPDYADARNQLGVAYFQLKRFPEAVATFQEAIRLKPGDTNAYANLGFVYVWMGKNNEALQVYNTLQPISAALAKNLNGWIEVRTRAEQGDAEAQNSLGFTYDKGTGGPPDKVEAAKWYGKAAEQGSGGAQHNFCELRASALDLFSGVNPTKGQPFGPIEPIKGSKEAVDDLVKWCTKAAGKGFAGSQTRLGIFYAKGGPGINPDYEKAYFLLFVRPVDAFFEEVAKHLTEERRRELQKRLKEWSPSKTPELPFPN